MRGVRGQLKERLPQIGRERFPRVKVGLTLSKSLVDWLLARAQEDQARDGQMGRPSMSAVVERLLRQVQVD